MVKKIGIIDLGSNSVRLVIFEVRQNGSFRLIDDISDNIRLSEGMIEGRYLNDFAMRRAVKTVKMFKNLCLDHCIPDRDVIAVATEAVRKAKNRESFLKLLNSSTGLSFKVLTGEEEALYVYRAIAHTIDMSEGVVVDIGGGSTEIIKFKDKSVVHYVSLPIGAVRATEEFLEKDIIQEDKLESLENQITSLVSPLLWLAEEENPVIIGLGGTIRNLGAIHKKKMKYPLEVIHNYPVDIEDFYTIYDELKGLNLEERKKVKGLSSKRADIIVGGLAIFKVVASLAGTRKLIISGHGLREGIFLEYMMKNKYLRMFTDALNFSLNNCMKLYGIRQEHANHVCHLSLSMFDQLGKIHGMGQSERNLLKVASLLHDIGIAISYYEHYQHTFYLILNSRLNGLSHREILLAAAVAASHGNKDFDQGWYKEYKSILRDRDIEIYGRLSILLKIAECLDRGETGIIKDVECQVCEDIVRFRTVREGDAELELNLANENNERFKKLFNMSFVIS